MNFELDDDQAQLQDSLRRVLASHGSFQQRRTSAAGATNAASAGNAGNATIAANTTSAASADGSSRTLWQHLAALGVPALTVDGAHGGFGRGATGMLPVLQACGHALLLEPVLASCVLGSTALGLAADATLRQRLLPAVASGDVLLAWAHDEPQAGHAALWVETRASMQGGQWRLSGRKCNVLHCAAAQHLVVTARVEGAPDDAAGLALFLVDVVDVVGVVGVKGVEGVEGVEGIEDARARGLQLRPHRLVDDTPAAECTLHATPALPLGDPHDAAHASRALHATLNAGIAAACAEMLGAMELAFELAVAYMQTRTQFGRAIGQNQALRHKAAEMLVSLEACRSMAMAAAVACDRPADPGALADLHRAKLMLGRHARLVCEHAVQIHGGIGITEDCAVGHTLRRVHVLDQLFGDSATHAARLAAMADLADLAELSDRAGLSDRAALAAPAATADTAGTA